MAKRDNSSLPVKRRLRAEVAKAAGVGAVVFEGYCGTGALWRSAWSGMRGIAVDKDEARAHAAALERPTWGCYTGDTVALLAAGVFGRIAFSVIDLDPHGEPWPALKAWLTSERARAGVTHVVMTDGYMTRQGVGAASKALYGGEAAVKRMSRRDYVRFAQERVAGWCRAPGLRVVSWETWHTPGAELMAHHVLRIRAGGPAQAGG